MKAQQNQNKIITIEGNIGSGKSTLLQLIDTQVQDIQIIKEPVCQWQQIGGNSKLNLLEHFYNDPLRWGYTFQQYAYYSRLRQWTEMALNKEVAISERSVLSDRYIFAENGRKSGIFKEIEWELYMDYFSWLTSKFKANKINGVIYIRTDPQLCHDRIFKRGRTEETDSIPISYL